mmetsp:Transcript_63839/g.106154  ORF Transcript_63839/g.106154 Transcript_63839/m.106154 type:complete len:89 (-) Transcript_63839:478-744(-)
MGSYRGLNYFLPGSCTFRHASSAALIGGCVFITVVKALKHVILYRDMYSGYRQRFALPHLIGFTYVKLLTKLFQLLQFCDLILLEDEQ